MQTTAKLIKNITPPTYRYSVKKGNSTQRNHKVHYGLTESL